MNKHPCQHSTNQKTQYSYTKRLYFINTSINWPWYKIIITFVSETVTDKKETYASSLFSLNPRAQTMAMLFDNIRKQLGYAKIHFWERSRERMRSIHITFIPAGWPKPSRTRETPHPNKLVLFTVNIIVYLFFHLSFAAFYYRLQRSLSDFWRSVSSGNTTVH